MPVIPVMPSYPPMAPARPGAVTALGVISIILAIVGMIASVATAGFAFTAMLTAQMQRITASTLDAQRYPLLVAAQASTPDSVTDQQADFIVEAFSRTRPLSPTRRQHVRSLARMHGGKLFSFDVGNITILRAKANISDSGPVLLGTGRTGDFYVTGTGRLEVSDANAIFRPDNGAAVRSGDVAVDRSLSETDITTLLSAVQSTGGLQLSPAQVGTVRRLLRDPEQSIAGAPPAVLFAGPFADGGAWFETDKAQVRIDSLGNETLLSLDAPHPGTNLFAGRPVRTLWSQMLLVSTAASGGLAILLLIGAIFVLRGRPVGRKILTFWSLIKLPVAIAGSVMLGLTVWEWLAAFSGEANQQPTPPTPWSIGVAVAIGLFGIAWPIIVLVVLSRRSVKEHFQMAV